MGIFTRTAVSVAVSHAIAVNAFGAVYVVDDPGDNSPAGDGKCTLREAVVSHNSQIANADCTVPDTNSSSITFANTITADTTISLTQGQLSFSRDLVVLGPIPANPSDDLLKVSQTTANNRVIDINNGSGNAGPNISFANLHFADGDAAGFGGGILANYGTQLSLTDCTVSDNTSNLYGGGIAVTNASQVSLERTNIEYNSASLHGGGVSVTSASILESDNSRFDGNTSSDNGGGISLTGASTAMLSGSSDVTYNNAFNHGGGIWAISTSSARMEGGSISHNKSYVAAGGVHLEGNSQLVISDVVASQNFSSGNAGGVNIIGGSTASVANSAFYENDAFEGAGGAFAVVGLNSSLGATNSTISINTAAGAGGGIYVSDNGSFSLNHVTMVANRSDLSGGAIGLYVSASGELGNSIVMGNTATGAGKEVDVNSQAFGMTYKGVNFLGESSNTSSESFSFSLPGGSNILATSDSNTPMSLTEVLDRALKFNGGKTKNHALLKGAAPIGKADFSLCEPLDQRGFERDSGFFTPIAAANGKIAVVNFGEGACDIGAVEFQASDNSSR